MFNVAGHYCICEFICQIVLCKLVKHRMSYVKMILCEAITLEAMFNVAAHYC